MDEASTSRPAPVRAIAAEQNRRPQVVTAGVQGRVAEVDAQPDHRRQVADRTDAAQRIVDRLRITDVAVHELEAGIIGKRGDTAGVDTRQQRVKHSDLMAGSGERLDNMRPDKTGAAGH